MAAIFSVCASRLGSERELTRKDETFPVDGIGFKKDDHRRFDGYHRYLRSDLSGFLERERMKEERESGLGAIEQ